MRLVLTALNHVLTQQVWARDRLRTHAGRIVRIVLEGPLGPLPIQSRITEAGSLEAVQDQAESPAVTLTLRVSANSLGALLSQGVEGLTGHLRIDGDVMVAAAVADVARHLRWDVKEKK